jgi:colanic acid biosynthesis glycosyl transferase WcaI
MHVAIVSAIFPPEPVVSAQTSAHVAEALVQRGHRVSVITTFPNRPAGKLYPGYSRRLYRREKTPQGFEITRCFSILSPRSSLASRFLENVSFGLTSGWAVLRLTAPDLVYANTWPILASGILFAVCRLRRIPLVISVQDVYPESLVAQQRIQAGGVIARCMQWLDGLIARGAQAVLVISERFSRIYRESRGVIPARVHVVPNWLDENSIALRSDRDGRPDRFRNRLGIPPQAFVLAYGGNIGVAAGLETVIEASLHLGDREAATSSERSEAAGVYLLIGGEGSRLAACQALTQRSVRPHRPVSDPARGRVVFHTPWPVEETSLLLRSADVLVLPTRGTQSLASVPSKLVSYMLAARPVIALALPDSDVAELIERSGCGWVVEPDDPERLAARIEEVKELSSDELARRGHAGREFALRNLSRSINVPRAIDILERAAAEQPRSRPPSYVAGG